MEVDAFSVRFTVCLIRPLPDVLYPTQVPVTLAGDGATLGLDPVVFADEPPGVPEVVDADVSACPPSLLRVKVYPTPTANAAPTKAASRTDVLRPPLGASAVGC